LNPEPHSLDASTLPLGYRGGCYFTYESTFKIWSVLRLNSWLWNPAQII